MRRWRRTRSRRRRSSWSNSASWRTTQNMSLAPPLRLQLQLQPQLQLQLHLQLQLPSSPVPQLRLCLWLWLTAGATIVMAVASYFSYLTSASSTKLTTMETQSAVRQCASRRRLAAGGGVGRDRARAAGSLIWQITTMDNAAGNASALTLSLLPRRITYIEIFRLCPLLPPPPPLTLGLSCMAVIRQWCCPPSHPLSLYPSDSPPLRFTN